MDTSQTLPDNNMSPTTLISKIQSSNANLPSWVWPVVCISISYGASLLSHNQHSAVIFMFMITVIALICLEVAKTKKNDEKGKSIGIN